MPRDYFLKTEYGLLDKEDYLRFAMSPAHLTWWFLRRRICRDRNHPEAGGFYRRRMLVALASSRDLVSDWRGLRSRPSIQRDLDELNRIGLIEAYPDPNGHGKTVFVLGTWAKVQHAYRTRGLGSDYVEVLYADRIFRLEAPEDIPEDEE